MNDLVSIIIVNWNGRKYLDECITSLFNQSCNNRIILVDNASTDGSVEYVMEKFPHVEIIQNKANLGFAKAINIGIRAADTELIALFNQDAVAEREWLSLLVKAVKNSPKAAASGGKIYHYGSDKNIASTWCKIDPYTAAAWDFTDDEPASEVDYLPGCAMLIKKEVIDEIGYLDEGYFMYFDETDFCARMIRAGYDLLYVPEAVIWHVVAGSITESRKMQYMTRNRIRFALKNFDQIYIPGFVLFYLVETVYFLFQTFDLTDTRMRIRGLIWNLLNIGRTFSARRKDFGRIKKVRSYNKSLPLRGHKISKIEQVLGRDIRKI